LSYAAGKYAFGYCDLTGFRYPIKDLVPQIKNGRPTGLRVGKDGGGVTSLGSRTVGLNIEAKVGQVTVTTS
jgi:hypothetical protein